MRLTQVSLCSSKINFLSKNDQTTPSSKALRIFCPVYSHEGSETLNLILSYCFNTFTRIMGADSCRAGEILLSWQDMPTAAGWRNTIVPARLADSCRLEKYYCPGKTCWQLQAGEILMSRQDLLTAAGRRNTIVLARLADSCRPQKYYCPGKTCWQLQAAEILLSRQDLLTAAGRRNTIVPARLADGCRAGEILLSRQQLLWHVGRWGEPLSHWCPWHHFGVTPQDAHKIVALQIQGGKHQTF